MRFGLHIGIDYSGAKTSTSPLKGLQVYAVRADRQPEKVSMAARWTRREIAESLVEFSRAGISFIAGIDHAFSFPATYLDRYGLKTWNAFLADFCEHWPTNEEGVTVESLRKNNARTGTDNELRLTERWTSSAKSVFKFDVPGQVAKSTHAGIPWLNHIRQAVGSRIHCWPFDGWKIPDGKSVIAEVYPSIFRNRYELDGRTGDEQDAYATSRWLCEVDRRNVFDRYLEPPLTKGDAGIAKREGWILGVA